MAGDWIKMRSNLWDDPRVSKLCDLLECGEAQIVGALYWLWSTADQHTEDGVLQGMSLRQIDRKTGVPGFAQGLIDIGWLSEHADGLEVARFEEHNGTTAKKRAVTAKRVANHRGKDDVTQAALQGGELGKEEDEADVTQEALAREEKEKEKEKEKRNTSPTDLSAAKPPPCPHKAILGLYAKHLPTMPQPKPELWDGQRAKNLSARWKWLLTKTRQNGERYATDEDGGLAWFDRFFGYVAKSDFLTGRDGRWTNCDLGWLVNAENFAKVVQGNYENKAAA
jgi:hypothetical protein